MTGRRALGFGLLVLALAGCGPSTGIERPFLWEIERDPPAWVFGTIHVAAPEVTALPDEVAFALDRCDALYTEIALDETPPAGALRLPPGETIKSHLPPALYRRLTAWLGARGLTLQPFEDLRVWALALQLLRIELAERFTGAALDQVLWDRAKAAARRCGALETVAEQLGLFAHFSVAEQCALIEGVLDLDGAPVDPIAELIAVYRRGDEREIVEVVDRASGLSDPELAAKFEEVVLLRRNETMARRIAAELAKHPRQRLFFAVGAAHLPGERGLLELLQAQGIRPRRAGGTAR